MSQNSRRKTRACLGLDLLEGRRLLSHVGARGAETALIHQYGGPNLHLGLLEHPGPMKQIINRGGSAKVARFYALYTGPINGALNAAGVKGFVTKDGQTLFLAGIVGGPISTKITDPTQSLYYSFGINRGGANQPGPFPGRHNIRFDAVVNVSITPTGVASNVLLNNGVSVPLDPSAVRIGPDNIQVFVPTSLLPSTGADVFHYRAVFFPSSAPFGSDYHTIASFIPEASTFAVGQVNNLAALSRGH